MIIQTLIPKCKMLTNIPIHRNSYTKTTHPPIWQKWPTQTFLHLSVTAGLALVVVGATSNGQKLALEKVGYIVFLGIWILLCVFAFLSLKQGGSNVPARKVT